MDELASGQSITIPLSTKSRKFVSCIQFPLASITFFDNFRVSSHLYTVPNADPVTLLVRIVIKNTTSFIFLDARMRTLQSTPSLVPTNLRRELAPEHGCRNRRLSTTDKKHAVRRAKALRP